MIIDINLYGGIIMSNKPIKKRGKIKRLKRGSIIILSIYMLLVFINVIIYYIKDMNLMLVYSSCIYVGILWQVFTLTKYGHVVVNKIDSLLIKFFNIVRPANNSQVKN